MATIEDAVREVFNRLGLPYLRDEQDGSFVTAIPVTESEHAMVGFHINEAGHEAMIETVITPVLPRNRAAVALKLATINHSYKFVTFSLGEQTVHADICIELTSANDTPLVIALSLARLVAVLRGTYQEIVSTAQAKRRRKTRAEREAEEVLRRLDI
jgi:hypothetical protein